jgi:hypothetical protein
VAPLRGIDDLHVDGVRLWFEESKRQAPQTNSALRQLDLQAGGAVEIVAETRRITNTDEEPGSLINLAIGDLETTPTRPVYLPDYCAWEHRVGHHDPLTDTFSLGMILASLACGLDFRQSDDLERFVGARRNLFAIAPGLHPVLAQAIVQMTALSPRDRAPTSHLFMPMPDVIRENMAFLDRIHFYIPGWEIPKMRVEFFTDHYGFVVDYLAEALRELRKNNFTEMSDRHFSLGSHLNARDVKAVRKSVSGLVKLIYPHGELSREPRDADRRERLAALRLIQEHASRHAAATYAVDGRVGGFGWVFHVVLHRFKGFLRFRIAGLGTQKTAYGGRRRHSASWTRRGEPLQGT